MANVTDGEPLAGSMQLRRFEFKGGEILDITNGESVGAAAGRFSSGGGAMPEISPNGRWLAFARQLPERGDASVVPDATALSSLWRGRGEYSYGEAAVIGTAAAALLTLGCASDVDAALALARDYWRRRGAWCRTGWCVVTAWPTTPGALGWGTGPCPARPRR